MAYNDTPLANEAKSASQPKMRNNFNVLQNFLALNHEDPDTGTGKHSFVTLPVHAAPATAAGEAAIYSKTVGANTELYVRRDNVADEIPLMTSLIGNNTFGFVLLPGGLKVAWGTGVTNADLLGAAGVQIDLSTGVPHADWVQFTQQPAYFLTTGPQDKGGSTDSQYNVVINKQNIVSLWVWGCRTDHSTPHNSYAGINFTWLAIGK